MKNIRYARKEEFEVEPCDCGECRECLAREEAEMLSELINEMGDDLLNELETLPRNECPCCKIKEYLLEIYKLAYQDGRRSLASSLGELMDEIVFED
jgi:hypothetical protein